MGKILLERAEKTASAVIKQLAPYCKKIAVAGSIRRRRPWVNDVDIVLVAADPWQLHQAVLRLGQAKVAGSKIMRVMMGDTQVDIYFATEDTWATLLLIRTGSAQHNIHLCSLAKEKGMKLHADGSGLFALDDFGVERRVAGDTEASIFAALGLPYKRPEERE